MKTKNQTPILPPIGNSLMSKTQDKQFQLSTSRLIQQLHPRLRLSPEFRNRSPDNVLSRNIPKPTYKYSILADDLLKKRSKPVKRRPNNATPLKPTIQPEFFETEPRESKSQFYQPRISLNEHTLEMLRRINNYSTFARNKPKRKLKPEPAQPSRSEKTPDLTRKIIYHKHSAGFQPFPASSSSSLSNEVLGNQYS